MTSDHPLDNNPNIHPEDQLAGLIPRPRPAPDEHPEDLPHIGSDQPVWWYDQERKRGQHRRYRGHVTRIGGTEGDRIRAELTANIRELLTWAKQQTELPDTTSEQDGDSA